MTARIFLYLIAAWLTAWQCIGAVWYAMNMRIWVYLFAGLLLVCISIRASYNITVSWDGVSNAASYKVYSGAASKTYTTSTNVGNVTNATIGVSNNPVYLAATAMGSTGLESAFSNEEVNDTNVYVTDAVPYYAQALLCSTNNGAKSSRYIILKFTNTISQMPMAFLIISNYPIGTNFTVETNPPTTTQSVETPKPPRPDE